MRVPELHHTARSDFPGPHPTRASGIAPTTARGARERRRDDDHGIAAPVREHGQETRNQETRARTTGSVPTALWLRSKSAARS
jgi:hypothetical protein